MTKLNDGKHDPKKWEVVFVIAKEDVGKNKKLYSIYFQQKIYFFRFPIDTA